PNPGSGLRWRSGGKPPEYLQGDTGAAHAASRSCSRRIFGGGRGTTAGAGRDVIGVSGSGSPGVVRAGCFARLGHLARFGVETGGAVARGGRPTRLSCPRLTFPRCAVVLATSGRRRRGGRR